MHETWKGNVKRVEGGVRSTTGSKDSGALISSVHQRHKTMPNFCVDNPV